MARILNIETSTTVCSVSLAEYGQVKALKETFEDRSHATVLTVFVDEVLKELNLQPTDINAVSVSEGPGSYTGLRIGVSVAKGLCYALGIPLIAVNTLQAMAAMAVKRIENKNALLCPMIDARRMEVYSQLFTNDLRVEREVRAEVLNENSYLEILKERKIYFFGNGAEKFKEVVKSENALFVDNIFPSAEYMAQLSHKAYNNKEFRDVAYFEPFYLKDFVATTPKKKVF